MKLLVTANKQEGKKSTRHLSSSLCVHKKNILKPPTYLLLTLVNNNERIIPLSFEYQDIALFKYSLIRHNNLLFSFFDEFYP